MVHIVTVPSATELDSVVDVLDRDGAVIIEDFVDATTLRGLQDDLGPALDAAGHCTKGYDGHRTRRISSLLARTDHVVPVITQPLYVGAARALLQQPGHMWVGRARIEITPNIQLSATQAIQIDPGQGKQPLHRDDALHLRQHPGPPSRLQLMLALTDFTPENGATLVIPGSHHWDDETPPRYDGATPAAMSAGSALLWQGGVFHGGGANTTDRPRVSLTVSLDLGNLRQEENQYLAVPREKVLTYPEDLRRLLGYDQCPPGVGWFEMQDPHLTLVHHDLEQARSVAAAMAQH